jgi:hypothetical protein
MNMHAIEAKTVMRFIAGSTHTVDTTNQTPFGERRRSSNEVKISLGFFEPEIQINRPTPVPEKI